MNSQNKHHSQSSVLHYQGKLSCSTETEEYILMKTTENLLKVQQATIRNVRIVADLHRSRWFAMLTYFLSFLLWGLQRNLNLFLCLPSAHSKIYFIFLIICFDGLLGEFSVIYSVEFLLNNCLFFLFLNICRSKEKKSGFFVKTLEENELICSTQ